MKPKGYGLALVLALAAWSSLPLHARVLVAVDQAVREAFPGTATEKETAYLTDAQAHRIQELAGAAPPSRIVVSYRPAGAQGAVARAYLDTHIVRTEPETILVLLDAKGAVTKVAILAFSEPDEYQPKDRWLEQFQGRALDHDLSLRGGIRGITGASLTSTAITAAVRRVLATDQVLDRNKPAVVAPAPSTEKPPAPNKEEPPATPPAAPSQPGSKP